MAYSASLMEPRMKYEPTFRHLDLETFGYNIGANFCDNFKDMLADNVEMKWDNLVSSIAVVDQMEP
eukprot:9350605-Ditylum_brightwellii.AAC.1